MNETVLFNHVGGVIGFTPEEAERVYHFDREFLTLQIAGILKDSERWEYINDCLRDEGIIDDHIFITGRCSR